MRGRAAFAGLFVVGLGLGVLTTGPVGADTTAVDLGVGGFVRFDGAVNDDWSGQAVARAGDVNGDGYDDLLIGAPYASNNGRTSSGSTYVIFGSTTPASHDLAALGTAGFRIDGAATGDLSGSAVSGAGDVNRDGYADLLVASPNADHNGRTDSGSAYVVYGSAAPVDVDLASPSAAWFRIDGATADLDALAVAGAGDVNGDGFADLLIGAKFADYNGRADSGSSYVVFGGMSLTNRDLATLGAGGFRIDGAAAHVWSGWAVDGAGDMNGDGKDDVLIGSPQSGYNSRPLSGSAYVVYGKSTTAPLDLATLAPSAGFRIDGAVTTDRLGLSVAGAGDVNADGRPDVLIGAPLADNNGRTDSGSSYLVYGSAAPSRVDVATLGEAGFRVDGAAATDDSGGAVAGAGDVNADGYDDVLIGADLAGNNGRVDSGSAYVVYGSSVSSGNDLANLGTGGFRIDGAAAGDYTGAAVAGAGDINRDHADDVLIGAYEANGLSRVNSGSTYVVFGTPPPQVTPTPTPRASLTVKARKAARAVPRTGKVTLVKKVTVGPGQATSISVKVKPKETKKKVRVLKTKTTVKVRTRNAPKGKVTVRITASGSGFKPKTWIRTWKVR